MDLSPADFGVSFKNFLDQVAAQKPEEEPVFVRHLREHFGTAPQTLPIVSERFEKYDHANVHVALEELVSRDGRSASMLGIVGPDRYSGTSLADLVAPPGSGLMGRFAPA